MTEELTAFEQSEGFTVEVLVRSTATGEPCEETVIAHGLDHADALDLLLEIEEEHE